MKKIISAIIIICIIIIGFIAYKSMTKPTVKANATTLMHNSSSSNTQKTDTSNGDNTSSSTGANTGNNSSTNITTNNSQSQSANTSNSSNMGSGQNSGSTNQVATNSNTSHSNNNSINNNNTTSKQSSATTENNNPTNETISTNFNLKHFESKTYSGYTDHEIFNITFSNSLNNNGLYAIGYANNKKYTVSLEMENNGLNNFTIFEFSDQQLVAKLDLKAINSTTLKGSFIGIIPNSSTSPITLVEQP